MPTSPTDGPARRFDAGRLATIARCAEEARLTAPAMAARLLRRVLDELDPDDPRRADLLGRLATAELFSGRLREAESIARGVVGAGSDRLDPDGHFAFVLGQSVFLQGRITEAGELFADVDGRERGARDAMVLVDVASAHMFAGDLDAANRAGAQSLLVARAAGDHVGEVAALAVLSSVLGLGGDLRAAVECGRAAAARADRDGIGAAHRNAPHLFLANALLWADQLDECRDALDRAAEVGHRLQLGWDEPMRLATLADVLFRTGEWDVAVATAEQGLGRSLARGAGLGDVWMRCVLARVHLHRGELDPAAEEAASAEQLVRRGATGIERVTHLGALHAEAAGDLDAARSTLHALWTELDERGIALKQLEIACDTARLARRCDDRALGATVVETIRQLANRCPDSVAPALLARCRGLVDADPELLARAAIMLRARRRPLEQAFTESEAAALFADRGDHGRAAAMRAAAQGLLGPLRAHGASVAADGAASSGAHGLAWCSLTPAEHNVVDLVADGLSNAAIAARLICSRRTVESHLHHVYTKLGIGTRVALAVEARQRRRAA
jgi:DNA-binding CsgD family transcriptional regulator/tetratricopeptide (TPR) repeat protein